MLRRFTSRLRARLLGPVLAELHELDLRVNHLEVWLGTELQALRDDVDRRSTEIARQTTEDAERRIWASIHEVTERARRETDALRSYTEAAVGNAEAAAIEVARAHAEASAADAETTAVEAARAHAEAAASTAETRAIEVAGQHAAEAATAAEVEAIAAARAHLEASNDAIVASSRTHAEEAIEQAVGSVRRELALVRSAAARAATGTSNAASVSTTAHTSPTEPEIDDLLYVALENRFRGDPALVAERQQRYVAFVEQVADDDHPVLDLGCGRGEWLGVLAEAGIPATGIDSNRSAVDECRQAGLDADVGDLVEVLGATAAGSIGAITMFQVVEHLPFGVLVHTLAECRRVLRPGGVLICETPNALNLNVAASSFWLDPTHERPMHPELLRFLAEESGFAKTEDVFCNALGTPPDFTSIDGDAGVWLGDLAESLDGPGDYALVAWTSESDPA